MKINHEGCIFFCTFLSFFSLKYNLLDFLIYICSQLPKNIDYNLVII